MKTYKLTKGTATVYEGKEEIEPVVKTFIKNEEKLKNVLNQWRLSNNCTCDICILFKGNETNIPLAIFRNQWGNAFGLLDATYSMRYGSDFIKSNYNFIFNDLINEFFKKNEEFILPYQKSFLKMIENYNRIYIPLLTKNSDLIDAKILKKYFWFNGDTIRNFIEIDGVGNHVLYYNSVNKKHFIYVDGRNTEVQVFFDKKLATDYALNILENRLNSKIRQVEDLEKRINKIKSID